MDFAVPPVLEIDALRGQRNRLADSAAEWEAAAEALRQTNAALVEEMRRMAARIDELSGGAPEPTAG